MFDGTSVSYSTLDFASQKWARPQITKVEPKGFKGTGSSRNIDYVCTYVKNGIESIPSEPFSATYALPWNQEALMEITCAKGNNETEPDYYNIYKKVSSDYGMIATVGTPTVVNIKPVSYVGTVLHTNTWRGPTGNTGSKIRGLSEYYSFHDKLFNGRLGSTNVPYVDIIGGASASALTIDFGDNSSTKISTFELQLDAFTCSITGGRAGRGYITYKITYNRHGNATFLKATATFTTAQNTTIAIEKTVKVAQTEYSPVTLEAGDARGGSYVNNPQIEHLNRSAIFDFSEDIKNNSTLSSDQTWQIKSIVVTFYDNETDKNIVTGYFHGMKLTNSFSNKNILQDDYITPDLSLTPPQDGGHFDKTGDYPSCVGIYKQRLAFASTENDPFMFWLSCVGDLYNFNTHASIREDDAISATLAATEFPKINHIIVNRDLMLLADSGEWTVAPVSGNTLSYKTLSADMQSAIGCAKSLKPISVGDEIVFVKRTGETLLATRYNFTSDGYESMDLSVLSQWIFRNNPIVQMAYRQHPDSTIECVLADGTMASLVYMKEHEVCAWSRHELGGGWKARDVATSKAMSRGSTEVMIVVERDGRCELWAMRDDVPVRTSAPAAADHLCMDGVRELAEHSSAISTGDESSGSADSAGDERMVVVQVGGKRYAGYLYKAQFATVRPEPQGGETIQFEVKNAKDAEVRVLDSGDFRVRAYGVPEKMATKVSTGAKMAEDGSAALATGDFKRVLAGCNNGDGRVVVESETPLPLNILSISVNYEIQPLSGSAG